MYYIFVPQKGQNLPISGNFSPHSIQNLTEFLTSVPHFLQYFTLVFSGVSGCGKSTILSIVAGLENKSSGKIYVDGVETEDVSSKIGYMLQQDSLFDWRNILDNCLIGLKIKKELKSNVNHTELPKKQPEVLHGVSLNSFDNLNHLPFQFY